MTSPKQVAILIETDDTWGRSVVAAIAAYARGHNWQLLIAPRDSQHRLRLPRRWRGDGVLVSLRDRSMANHLRRAALPAVDVSIMMPRITWLGRVATDDTARAELAFQHFRSRGFRNFACYAPAIGRYSIDRVRAFQNVAETERFCCDILAEAEGLQGWEIDSDTVMRWLAGLPRPLGVFAADPYPARQLAEICEVNGVRVPEDVAILSGDNDELLCSVASPELSSIQLASEQIGRTASKLLTKLMKGTRVPEQPLLIPPLTIHTRRSTDTYSVSDDQFAEILRFIGNNAAAALSVTDILRKFPQSRRQLELNFRTILQCSPAEHIRRIRMEKVKRELLDTESSVTEIAFRNGFSSSSGLTQQFTRHFGRPPIAFRRTPER